MQNREPSSFRVALAITLLFRLLYSAVGLVMAPHLKLDPARIATNRFTSNLLQRSDGLRYGLLGVWERFDTLWYIHIAQNGYDLPEAVVFYPLYPGLLRAVSSVIGNPLVAALAVSTIATFFLFWGLHRLLRLDCSADTALRALVLFGAWPAAFIFFAGYAESLVIALMVWSVYFARTDRWLLAGLVGVFAGLAKAVGSLVAVPLAVIAWRNRKWRTPAIALCLTGSAAFVFWLKLSGHMLPAQAYSHYWGTDVAPPWVTLSDSIRQALFGPGTGPYAALRLHLIVLLFVSFLALSRTIRPEYLAYSAAALLFLLTKHSDPAQQQWSRYLLIVFPAQANLACTLKSTPLFVLSALLLFATNLIFMWNFMDWVLIV